MKRLLLGGLACCCALVGCRGGDNPEAGCSSNAECDPGYICDGGDCFKICLTQGECPQGEICSAIGVCVEPAEGDLPHIDGVVGNDPTDTGRIIDGLIVSGRNLTDSVFELDDGTAAVPLVVRSQSGTSAEVVLPVDVFSGSYTLVATNQAGSNQAIVQLELPQITGQMMLDRINTDATGTLAPARLDFGSAAGQVAEGNHTHDMSAYYTSAEVDSGFYSRAEADARFAARLAATSGGNYVPNADFADGLAGWSIAQSDGGGLRVVAVSGAVAGGSALENETQALVWASSDTWVLVNQNNTYRVTGSFKRLPGGSAGNIFLAVRLRQANGTEIIGDGTWWYYPAEFVQPAEDVWTSWKVDFGAGTGRPFPAEAYEMTVGFIINYDTGGVRGTRTYQVQGLGLFDSAPWRTYVDQLFCENSDGTYDAASGTCDPNMTVGTGSYNATSCPTDYRVCTVPEAMRRARNTSISGWHWVAHEANNPATGNLDQTGPRYSYPYCPNTNDAPLVYLGAAHGRWQVISVICYDTGYTPLCCR